jgi:hypothetical protein
MGGWATRGRHRARGRVPRAPTDARYVTGNTLFVDGGGHINGVSWAPNLPD